MRLRITFFLSTLIFLWSGFDVHAQILIEQGKLKYNVVAGDTIIDKINVHNTDPNRSVIVRVYLEDFMYVEPYNGDKNFQPAGILSDYSLRQWISFSPAQFTLAPLAKRSIDISLAIPSSPQLTNGHYGTLFFEVGSSPGEQKRAINVVSRVGSLLFVEPVDKVKTANIDNFTIETNSIQGDYTNTGNIFAVVKGIYYTLDAEGQVVQRDELEALYIPPDATAPFLLPVLETLPSGNYTTILTFDLEEGDSLLREIDFTKDADGQLTIQAVRE